jgi:[ribosomal protein S5]-alanine N-acetyltransferase
MKHNLTQDFGLLLNLPITTQRLALEPLVAAHADILYKSLCDERIYRWIESGGPKDLSLLRLKWRQIETRLSPDGKEVLLNWAIRLKNDGPYIGKLDAQLDSPTNATNVGFVFFPEYWGHGYATESLLAVRTVLAENGISFMRATVSTPNIASARVLEKAGFIRGDLVADEIDTHEFTLAIPKESISTAQQQGGGYSPPAARPSKPTP